MQKIFSLNGGIRPTLEEIREDPWFNKPYDKEIVQQTLLRQFKSFKK